MFTFWGIDAAEALVQDEQWRPVCVREQPRFCKESCRVSGKPRAVTMLQDLVSPFGVRHSYSQGRLILPWPKAFTD